MMRFIPTTLCLVACAAPAAAQAVTYVEPADSIYVELVVASASIAKKSVAKNLGVLQRDDAPGPLRKAIEAATQRLDLKPISLEDFVPVCRTFRATRSAPASRTCSMKNADAVVQFTTVLVAGDSGYVGSSITRIPRGSDKSETTHFCTLVVQQDAKWTALKTDEGPADRKCPPGGG